MKFTCSLIVVDDISKARSFYEKVLLQKVVTDFGENVAFEGGFAIHQKAHFQKLIDNLPIKNKSNGFELYFEEDNLEPIYETLKRMNMEFIHAIIEQPWKQKVMRFYDYDQNIIEIGERMEHVAFRLYKENMGIDDIAKITYLPNEVILNAIREYSKNE